MKTFSQTPTQLFTETQQTGITAGFPDLVHSSFKDGDWYTAFYNNIPVMLHSIDNSGYIIDVSEYWLLKLGYKREEVIGRKSIDFLTEESREYAISKVFPVFLKTGRVEDIQYQFVKKNGDIMDGLISSTSEKDDNGVVIRSFAVIIDITDRLRAEREKKTFLELSLDIVGSCGLDGYFREINPAVEKILGYTQEEFCSKSFMDFVHPDDVEKTLREAEKSFSGSPTVSFTNRYRCKDGTYKWLEWNTIPVGDYLHTIARDATKWKEAQEALQISENQFKGAFEYSAIGMALVSPEGRWKEVNEQVCEIIGYDKSELMKLTFQDITHPDDIDLDLRYLQELIEDKRPSYTMEKRYFHKNGTIVWVLLAVSKVTDKNNTILHYIAQIQNITERKKAEQQLREQAALLEVVPDAISIRDLD
ncbi:MAG TPA: PAS domain S-box protein, partial [Patescibacteria group bacterium]|nr:PAS domain S-box protein [Patescibacteria group bacterium]